MSAGKVFVFLGGILTLVGTYVFAVFGTTGVVGSGLGFAMNLPDLFSNADAWSTAIDIPVVLYYVYLVLLIIFLASGVLQMLTMQSRAVGFIFSLFPIAVSAMILLLVYTDILGITSAFFTIFFFGEQFGDFYPILVNLGDVALGTYFLLAGGVLGLLSVFMERD